MEAYTGESYRCIHEVVYITTLFILPIINI